MADLTCRYVLDCYIGEQNSILPAGSGIMKSELVGLAYSQAKLRGLRLCWLLINGPKNLHRLAVPYIKTLSLVETRILSSSSGAIQPGPSNYEIPCVERWESTRMRWRDPSERGRP